MSYNVQKVGGDQLSAVKNVNFVNSLNGAVAGVNINASTTGVGGPTRVVMRGTKSITGGNNVLYVIDGVPMLNKSGGDIGGVDTQANQAVKVLQILTLTTLRASTFLQVLLLQPSMDQLLQMVLL